MRVTVSVAMTTSIIFLVLCVSLQYFCITTLASQATCAPPPAIECKSNACDVFNYQGVWDDRGICKAQNSAWPTSEAELVQAVANAVKNKQRIKVVSKLSHSEPKLVCVGSEGLIISTQNYASVIEVNKTAMTIRVQAGALMSDVLEAAAKEGLALNAMIYWSGVSAAGVISTGAHDSGLVGKGSGVYEYVVAMRLVVPASPSQGYAKVISLTEADEELNAARLSLGTLGAISELTFALQPMYKRSISTVVKDDTDLEYEAESFLRAHEFADINWIPSHGKAVYIPIDRHPVNVPGDGLNSIIGSASSVVDIERKAADYEAIQDRADVEAICSVLINETLDLAINGSGFLNDGKRFTGYPVIGFNHHMQTSGGCQAGRYSVACTPTSILDKNETVCSWDRRIYATLYFGVELRVPVSRLPQVIKDVKRIRDLNPQKLCDMSGIFMRSIKKSDAYLGPKEDVVTLDMMNYRSRAVGTPKWNEDVYEEIEQMIIEKHGGVLHWGKSGGYLFQGLAKRATNLEKFMEVKKKFDSSGLFSNEWTDGLFGIEGGSLEIFRDGCALDKVCKCREDSHCAPQKGYFCKPGKVWKKARVCTKLN
ncbi:probable L-gulonolactone oxidase 4 [Cryptomeria japonica]|uniref:probable L-gulonolactone oxidase 4 n=1 Tax=Cryptomeria japonica TaxID=3369 RepID=UPI0027DAA5E7|nr:probable L-gulonolactone oxidase 4 [Cryptomeria japonica]XP_059076539.1 probable L-gulonolactone oxidase 4 [Cryptomeria japonica]